MASDNWSRGFRVPSRRDAPRSSREYRTRRRHAHLSAVSNTAQAGMHRQMRLKAWTFYPPPQSPPSRGEEFTKGVPSPHEGEDEDEGGTFGAMLKSEGSTSAPQARTQGIWPANPDSDRELVSGTRIWVIITLERCSSFPCFGTSVDLPTSIQAILVPITR